MAYSYWERQLLAAHADFTIVGAGLTGSFIAEALSRKYPKAGIQLIDAHAMPQGASTKNAGFICTGSASELLATADEASWDRMAELVERRWKGRRLLAAFLEYYSVPHDWVEGYELYPQDLTESYLDSRDQLDGLNRLMKDISDIPDYFSPAGEVKGFRPNVQSIKHESEGQIQPAHLLSVVHKILRQRGVRIIPGVRIQSYERAGIDAWLLSSDQGLKLRTDRLIFATNGLSTHLAEAKGLRPVRNQIIMSQRMDIPWKACIHMDRGYFYFRNVGRRLLAGGGRHLLGKAEETVEMVETTEAQQLICAKAQSLFVVPEIEPQFHWSGLLGVHDRPEPSVKLETDGVIKAIGLGGMGVAIGMQLAQEVLSLLEQ